MGRSYRRFTVAAMLLVALAATGLAGCSSSKGRSSLGPVVQAPGRSPGAAGGPGGAPGGMPPTGSVHGATPPPPAPHPGASGSSGGAGAPPSAPPPGGATLTLTFPPHPIVFTNYSIQATTDCFWEIAGDDSVQVGTQWKISYTGTAAMSFVAIGMTNDVSADTATSDTTVAGTFTLSLGSAHWSSSPFLGRTVTLTATISPQGTDTNSHDNTASVVLTVPSDLNKLYDYPTSIPCHT